MECGAKDGSPSRCADAVARDRTQTEGEGDLIEGFIAADDVDQTASIDENSRPFLESRFPEAEPRTALA